MKIHYHYHSFDAWLKNRHGAKVQKISLDAHAGCPNRDGTISKGGCTFCDAHGSGSGLMYQGLSLTEQWQFWREKFAKSDRLKHTHHFMAYLQSFSNTYGSAKRLRVICNELQVLKDIVGVSIGTRPDCIDEEKLRILQRLPWENTWLEFGVQSMHDKTLRRIARGHNVACSKEAIVASSAHGIKVCAHLMAGLPGESEEDFLETVRQICELPISGIKMHGLYICEGTKLAEEYRSGQYAPMEKQAYIELIAKAVQYIPSSITMHRLCADFTQDTLVAPEWAKQKGSVLRGIDEVLHIEGKWQGCLADVPYKNPYNENCGSPTSFQNNIFISLGSNTGNAKENLETALEDIRAYPKTIVKAVSSYYQTEPQGDKDQNWFYNQVICLSFKDDHPKNAEHLDYSKNTENQVNDTLQKYIQQARENAHELLDFLLALENKMGRVRDKNRRFGPRIIDLDIIYFGDICIQTEKLTVPHPRFLQRAFILIPLQEIATGLILSKASVQHVYSEIFIDRLFKDKKAISLENALKMLDYTIKDTKIFQP